MRTNILLWVAALMGSIFALQIVVPPLHAEWITPPQESPEITRFSGQPFAQPQFYLKNVDCTPDYVTYLRKGILSNSEHTSCVKMNRIGVFTSYRGDTHLQRTGADVMGRLAIGSVSTLPIPNTDHLVTFSGSGTMKNARIYRNLTRNMSTTALASGLLYHSISQASEPFPNDHTIRLGFTTTSVSTSGGWVLSRASNGSFARISTATGDATYFAKPTSSYPSSRIPQLVTAISSNGRYAAIASEHYGHFKLYDLDKCEGTGAILSCSELDMEPYLESQFPGYNNTRYIRFRSENTMEVKISTGFRETHEFVTLLITAPGQTPELFNYLALGDSFASGEGAYAYKPETNTQENRCHLSLQAYPHRIGQTLGFSSYDSLACSGAIQNDLINYKNPDGYQGQQEPKKLLEERKNSGEYQNIVNSFIPGYINQIDFVREYQPSIVTLSIGGNDIGFADIIKRCVSWPDTCYKTTYQKQQLEEEIYSLFYDLVKLYKDIKNAGNPNAHVYVVGYPSIVTTGRCDENVKLNESEIVFAETLVDTLNHTILQATRVAGVHYIDATDAFENHRLCEYTSVPAVHGITLNNDYANYRKYGLVAAESFHPTSFGHQLLTQKILDASSNFESREFALQPYQPPQVGDGSGFLSLEELITEVSPAKRRQDRHITTPVIYDQETLTIKAGEKDSRYMLRENEAYHVYLYSDPLYLGTLTTDEDGILDGEVRLPGDIPPGYHTVNIIGDDLHGHPLQVYQDVYVIDGVRLQELEEQERQSTDEEGEPADEAENTQGEPSDTNLECNDASQECILPLPIVAPTTPEPDTTNGQTDEEDTKNPAPEQEDDTQEVATPSPTSPPTNDNASSPEERQSSLTNSMTTTTNRTEALPQQNTPAEPRGQVAGAQDIAQASEDLENQGTAPTAAQPTEEPIEEKGGGINWVFIVAALLLLRTLVTALKGIKKPVN